MQIQKINQNICLNNFSQKTPCKNSKCENTDSDINIKYTSENKQEIIELGSVLGFSLLLPFSKKINNMAKTSTPKALGLIGLGLAGGTLVSAGIVTFIKMFQKTCYKKMEQNGQADKIKNKLENEKTSDFLLRYLSYVPIIAGDIKCLDVLNKDNIKDSFKQAKPTSKALMLTSAILTPLIGYSHIKNNIVKSQYQQQDSNINYQY